LHEGLVLTFYSDYADDHGQPDELRVEGVVHYDPDEYGWVAIIDWAPLQHASEERTEDGKPLVVAPLPEYGKSHTKRRG